MSLLNTLFGWLFGSKDSSWNPLSASKNAFRNLVYGDVSSSFNFDSFDGEIGSSLSDFVRALINRVSAEHLTGAEKEANLFNHQEAQLGRDWQEYFYNAYQSPQAQVQQYQQAGLNPALMYGNGAQIASPVASSGASSVSPQGASLNPLELIETLAGLSFRMKEMKADLALKSASAYKTRQEGDYIGKNIGAYEERLQREREEWELKQMIRHTELENISADTKVKLALENKYLQDVDESKARQLVAEFDAKLKETDLETRSAYNQACLSLVQSEEQLNVAQASLARAQESHNTTEIEYLEKRIANLKREQDDAHEQVQATINKLKNDNKLTEKEVEYFEDKFNLNVINTCNGVAATMKFASGTRFATGGTKFMSFGDDVGYVARKAGSNIKEHYKY